MLCGRMKPIQARDQVRLGPRRCMQLALSGMAFRMFRSSITIAILALAVAFLVHMLAYGLIAGRVQRAAWERLETQREAGRLLTRLTEPDPPEAIIAGLASLDDKRAAEYAAWGELSQAEVEEAQHAALVGEDVLAWFDDLSPQRRAILAGDLQGRAILTRLGDEERLKAFRAAAYDLSLTPPLGDGVPLERLMLEQWPRLRGTLERIRRGQARAIRRVEAEYARGGAGASLREVLIERPPGLMDVLRDAGYVVSQEQLAASAASASDAVTLEAIARTLESDAARAPIARRLDMDKGEVGVDTALAEVDSQAEAAWLAGVIGNAGGPTVEPGRLERLAEELREGRRLEAAVGDEEPSEVSGLAGLPTRTLWLVALSALVCAVGVANAMLMSVTERFTEIATMKCLGAMDRSVMTMFVFEAAIQGAVGGVIGLVLGLGLALLRGWADFGSLLTLAAPATGSVLLAAVISLGVGLLLATLAAVGPSLVAARLAPMEAMRVD